MQAERILEILKSKILFRLHNVKNEKFYLEVAGGSLIELSKTDYEIMKEWIK